MIIQRNYIYVRSNFIHFTAFLSHFLTHLHHDSTYATGFRHQRRSADNWPYHRVWPYIDSFITFDFNWELHVMIRTKDSIIISTVNDLRIVHRVYLTW